MSVVVKVVAFADGSFAVSGNAESKSKTVAPGDHEGLVKEIRDAAGVVVNPESTLSEPDESVVDDTDHEVVEQSYSDQAGGIPVDEETAINETGSVG